MISRNRQNDICRVRQMRERMTADTLEMLDEIQGRALLGEFRGEAAVRRDQLIQSLLALSRIGQAHPDVAEIDINPLIASEGEFIAVDVRIIVGL